LNAPGKLRVLFFFKSVKQAALSSKIGFVGSNTHLYVTNIRMKSLSIKENSMERRKYRTNGSIWGIRRLVGFLELLLGFGIRHA